MAISKVLTDTAIDNGAPGATVSVTLPTSVLATDILILAVGSGRQSAAVGSWSISSGWTLIGQLLDQTNASDHVTGQSWWALGNVGATTLTKVGTVASAGYRCGAFRGVDNVTPIDATGTANSSVANASSLTTNAVTVATANAWHVIPFFDWLGGTFSATGFTNSENAGVNETAAFLYNTTPKSTGSTGTVAVASSAATSGQVLIGIPFALRPAGGGATPKLRRNANLEGASASGPFFANPLGRRFSRIKDLFLPDRRILTPAMN